MTRCKKQFKCVKEFALYNARKTSERYQQFLDANKVKTVDIYALNCTMPGYLDESVEHYCFNSLKKRFASSRLHSSIENQKPNPKNIAILLDVSLPTGYPMNIDSLIQSNYKCCTERGYEDIWLMSGINLGNLEPYISWFEQLRENTIEWISEDAKKKIPL